MKVLRPYQKDAVEECWKALKANDEPVLLMASVGAGKSLMIANILATIAKAGKRALCLVNNAELVRNNCATLIDEGTHASIYCAALASKDCSAPIVFGTPQSILNGINKNEAIANIRFNILVVDEAHCINYVNARSSFIRILRHYKNEYPAMRLLGATGTNFRFKGSSIVGPTCLFKSQVGNITTEKLIDDGYLIKPHFEIDTNLVIDFSKVKIKKNGLFDQKELSYVIDKNTRLTELICHQIIHIMQSQQRFGVFLFATTTKHAYEILSHLPTNESAIILGDTPQEERTRILDNARKGLIKYLVNIAIISVGVDIPAFDTIAYLRPTESLVLLVQTMGRALRLSPLTKKDNALILDFAGNIERHRDWDNPLLLDAVMSTIDKDKPLVIFCPACSTFNTEHARRCIGRIMDARCDYFFEYKPCEVCQVQNDIAARICRACSAEIIDPNAKLSINILKKQKLSFKVIKGEYFITGTQSGFRLHCQYHCQSDSDTTLMFYENFCPSSEKAKNIFYGQFVRKHCDDASKWYTGLQNRNVVEVMLHHIKTPHTLVVEEGGKIKSKVFT